MSCTFLTCGSTMFFLSESSLNLLNIIVKYFLHMWVNYAPGVSCVYARLCVCTHTCPCMPQEHSSCVASSQTSVSQTIIVAELCEKIGLTLDARTLGQCSGRHFMLKHNYVQTLQSDVAHCTGRYWTSLGEISLAVVDC